MRVVSVKLRSENSRIYTRVGYYYKTTFHVNCGDEVIVNTINGLEVGLVDVEYVEDTKLRQLAKDYLVQRVDKSEYIRALDTENRIKGIKDEIVNLMSTVENEKLPTILSEYVEKLKGLSE